VIVEVVENEVNVLGRATLGELLLVEFFEALNHVVVLEVGGPVLAVVLNLEYFVGFDLGVVGLLQDLPVLEHHLVALDFGALLDALKHFLLLVVLAVDDLCVV